MHNCHEFPGTLFLHMQCVSAWPLEAITNVGKSRAAHQKQRNTHTHTQNLATCQFVRAAGNNNGRQILPQKTHRAHFALDNIKPAMWQCGYAQASLSWGTVPADRPSAGRREPLVHWALSAQGAHKLKSPTAKVATPLATIRQSSSGASPTRDWPSQCGCCGHSYTTAGFAGRCPVDQQSSLSATQGAGIVHREA
jgi:sugar phosphate isomerase/epimerase